ncbi:MAG: hypothetical protein OEU09_14050 [Rhodospirillales bacterium]|nr:hypothetical protein [Rhodospirillales bacterium]MDH3791313.1 hypothetical protein [Rhodospirillales bacterium]MDH3912411.1 hypothetical protein [Rhodospirillales bacterium]
MIYLVGTHHELQHTGAIRKGRAAPERVERARREFQSYLREKVLELSPALVAEELSQDLLTGRNGRSIAGDVAEKLGIEHRLCDPGYEERERLGIPGKADDLTGQARDQQFEIRERYWLECISDIFDSTVLFICGADHTSRFKALLVENGWRPKVLEPYWGKEIYGIDEN